MTTAADSKQYVLHLASLLQAIKEADVVYTQIRFGLVETWVKISKKETLGLYERLKGGTPGDYGLWKFGCLEVDSVTMQKVLYLG
jgi:hypothetical protein